MLPLPLSLMYAIFLVYLKMLPNIDQLRSGAQLVTCAERTRPATAEMRGNLLLMCICQKRWQDSAGCGCTPSILLIAALCQRLAEVGMGFWHTRHAQKCELPSSPPPASRTIVHSAAAVAAVTAVAVAGAGAAASAAAESFPLPPNPHLHARP